MSLRTVSRAAMALVALIAIAVGAIVASGRPIADILPDDAFDGAPTAEAQARGRALLAASLDAAGGAAAWARHRTQVLDMRDVWQGVGRLFNPWPAADVTVHLVQRRHTFDSRAVFTAGVDGPLTWEVRDRAAYERAGDGAREPVDDANIRFMLPTVQYFVELPQRLTEAELAAWTGETTVRGRTYDIVYATWGSWAANPKYDQYLVHVDRQTGRVGMLQYTVREAMRIATATAHLDDYREVDGLWIPFEMTVTAAPTDDPHGDGWMHRMTVTSVAFDSEDLD